MKVFSFHEQNQNSLGITVHLEKKWHKEMPKEMPKLYSSSCHFVHLIFNFVSFHLYFELLEL